jgi:hypothetical protein
LGSGDALPLPFRFIGDEFLDTTPLPVSGRSLLGASCCDANDDKVDGDGTAWADPSSDCGRPRRGRAKLLARAAKDGNEEDGEVIAVADGVTAASEIRPGVVGVAE